MKAQERHKLKTNELAQFFSELPEKFQKHGSLITSVALIAIIVLAGGILLRRHLVQGQQHQRDQLFQQLLAADALQLDALQRAQMGEQLADDPANALLPYDATSVTQTLAGIAREAPGKPVGMTATLLQAELYLSQIYFSDQNIPDDEKNQLLQSAQDLYQQTLDKFPNIPYAVGAAKIGLAAVAEERGQWDQARSQFEEVIALQEDLLAGTIYPKLAQRRMGLIESVSTPITFPEIKPIHPADFQAPDLMPDLTDLPPFELPMPDPNFLPLPTEIPPLLTEPNKIIPATQTTVTDPNIIKLPAKPVTDPNIIK